MTKRERHTFVLLSLLSLATASASCERKYDAVAQVSDYLIGTFSTEWQARTSPGRLNVLVESERVFSGRADGLWIYLQHSLALSQLSPYLHRVYHLRYSGTLVVASVYSISNEAEFKRNWRLKKTFETITGPGLVLREGCDIYFTRVNEAKFWGRVSPRSCPSSYSGADFVECSIEITPSYFSNWDRGYAANGTQVWGPKDGPYKFQRVEAPVSKHGLYEFYNI